MLMIVSVRTDSDDHVDPDLPVLESVHGELFRILVGQRGPVELKAEDDLSTFFFCQEGCTGLIH
jgi:hypothetical protein